MYSNWALRSGWPEPSSALRLTCRETDLGEQFAHGVGTDRVAHGGQRGCQLVEALRHPQQRTDRVAQRRRLHQASEIVEQRRINFDQWPGAAAFTANLTRGKGWPIEVFQPALDGTARQPRDRRDGLKTAPSGGARLARSKQSPTAFVPFRSVRFPPLPNRLPINHANAGTLQRRAKESTSTESYGRRPATRSPDSLIIAAVLS